MDALTFRLLSHLKRAFEDACNIVHYECESTGLEAGARQFYTRELSDNLVRLWLNGIARSMREAPEASLKARCAPCDLHLP